MRKLISSVAFAIVILLSIVQFGPSLLFGQTASHAKAPTKACHYRDHRSIAGPQGLLPAIADGESRARAI